MWVLMRILVLSYTPADLETVQAIQESVRIRPTAPVAPAPSIPGRGAPAIALPVQPSSLDRPQSGLRLPRTGR
jgi:hypothetical protein